MGLTCQCFLAVLILILLVLPVLRLELLVVMLRLRILRKVVEDDDEIDSPWSYEAGGACRNGSRKRRINDDGSR